MIPLAQDFNDEARVLRTLKTLWFMAVATALPLYDFVRSSSRLSLAGAVLGGLLLLALVGAHLYILRIGPGVLAYEECFHDLLIHTALKRYQVPIRHISKVSLVEGSQFQYRHGISVRGYHVGTFFVSGVGLVRVAASSLSSTGLLIEYRSRNPLDKGKAYLYLSPDEAPVVKLAIEDLMAENRWRVALGQP